MFNSVELNDPLLNKGTGEIEIGLTIDVGVNG